MNFSELEKLMSSHGVTSLADIARTLNTTPQAVSNWKARNQVPHHVVAKLNQAQPANDGPKPSTDPQPYSLPPVFEDTISLPDILLSMSEQLKVILIMPFITVFLTFTYILSNNQTFYESSAKILLPGNPAIAGGLMGIASQFGVNMSQGSAADLSSPSLFPEILNSYTFAERILDETFYIEEFQQELTLLAILTHGMEKPTVGRDTLVKSAISTFQGMITFGNEGSFSLLTVKASEPALARDINIKVLDELQSLNRYFKSQNVSERIQFIQSRIEMVGDDLGRSEQLLKKFREQNRQASSPALQLEQERLTRDVDIQKGIFLTLKQQQELANIEKIQSETVIQVLDEPQVPLSGSGINLKTSVLLAGVLGVVLGIMLGFVRSYVNQQRDIDERRKLRRVRNFLKKKSKDIVLDRRVSGLVSVLLLIGLPVYLNHKSNNPVYFGMYSEKLMLVNTVYVLLLISSIGLFIYLSRTNKKY